MDTGCNADSDLANEYCTDLNDGFLNLFDAPIQQTQQFVVFDHQDPWPKTVGPTFQVCIPINHQHIFL